MREGKEGKRKGRKKWFEFLRWETAGEVGSLPQAAAPVVPCSDRRPQSSSRCGLFLGLFFLLQPLASNSSRDVFGCLAVARGVAISFELSGRESCRPVSTALE